jgi:predicted O-methyltransferase YrrM
VLEDDRQFYVFNEAEILRNELINSRDVLKVEDFGAGSQVSGTLKERRVREIAQNALSPDFQCRWLFRMGQMFKPATIVELGTSLGISTLYLTEGVPREAKIFTLEGSSEVARIARRNINWFYDTFKKTGLRLNDPHVLDYEKYALQLSADFEKNKITIIEGRFEDTLPKTLQDIGRLDMAFIDGNHRYEPTLAYFEACLKYTHEGSVLIFDDVHWSEDMERAWAAIKAHPSVKLTIDLFWCGIVLFRNENREKEHFDLIKARLKPFNWGLFS